MTAKLMPYGSAKHSGLLTKVGTPKANAQLLPYAAADNAALAAKVLIEGKFCNDPAKPRVVRLNAGQR